MPSRPYSVQSKDDKDNLNSTNSPTDSENLQTHDQDYLDQAKSTTDNGEKSLSHLQFDDQDYLTPTNTPTENNQENVRPIKLELLDDGNSRYPIESPISDGQEHLGLRSIKSQDGNYLYPFKSPLAKDEERLRHELILSNSQPNIAE